MVISVELKRCANCPVIAVISVAKYCLCSTIRTDGRVSLCADSSTPFHHFLGLLSNRPLKNIFDGHPMLNESNHALKNEHTLKQNHNIKGKHESVTVLTGIQRASFSVARTAQPIRLGAHRRAPKCHRQGRRMPIAPSEANTSHPPTFRAPSDVQ